MACGGCERRVAEAALALPGVTDASADLVAEELDVTFDPALADLARIRAAVSAAGFIVS
jgi:copper chaperone CopZ